MLNKNRGDPRLPNSNLSPVPHQRQFPSILESPATAAGIGNNFGGNSSNDRTNIRGQHNNGKDHSQDNSNFYRKNGSFSPFQNDFDGGVQSNLSGS